MAGRLDGEVAIITGAARGKGKAEARMFASEAAKVVLTDIPDERGRQVANDINSSAFFIKHDVSQEEAWKQVVEKTVKTFGSVTILVNNTGIGLREDAGIEQTSLQACHKTLSVNLTGVL